MDWKLTARGFFPSGSVGEFRFAMHGCHFVIAKGIDNFLFCSFWNGITNHSDDSGMRTGNLKTHQEAISSIIIPGWFPKNAPLRKVYFAKNGRDRNELQLEKWANVFKLFPCVLE